MLAAFKLREAMLAKSGEERKRLHAAASRALNRADQTEIHRTELHTTTWVTQGAKFPRRAARRRPSVAYHRARLPPRSPTPCPPRRPAGHVQP